MSIDKMNIRLDIIEEMLELHEKNIATLTQAVTDIRKDIHALNIATHGALIS